jgi:hypothetical protein
MRTSQTRLLGFTLFRLALLRASETRFPSASLGVTAHQGFGPEFPLVFKQDKSGFRRSSPGRQKPGARAAQRPAIAADDH